MLKETEEIIGFVVIACIIGGNSVGGGILATPKVVGRRVARNSQWGGCFGGSPRRHGDLGAEPPALENFALQE